MTKQGRKLPGYGVLRTNYRKAYKFNEGQKDCESIGNCKVRIRTTDKNPADMDDMNEFYKQTLKGIYSNHDNAEKYYLCVTGGTQAMNSMLLINGVDMFKHRLEVLYVLPHKKNPCFYK